MNLPKLTLAEIPVPSWVPPCAHQDYLRLAKVARGRGLVGADCERWVRLRMEEGETGECTEGQGRLWKHG